MPLTRVDRMECPSCGADLQKGAPGMWVCPYCGAQYKDNTAPAPAPAPAAPPKPTVPKPTHPVIPKPAAKPAVTFKQEPDYFTLADAAVTKYFAKNKVVDIVVGANTLRTHKKLPPARANFGIAPSERCCLIIDDTFASTVKKGVCLTEKGIYLCGKNLPATHIPWKKFIDASLSTTGYAGFKISDVKFEFGLQTAARDPLYSVLQEIKQKATQPAEKTSLGIERTTAQYAQILDIATGNYTFLPKSDHLHLGLTNVMKAGHVYTRACENLGMSRSSNCYVLYSDGMFGFAKGFALCDTGLYLLAEYGPYAGQPAHLSMTQFEKAVLRTEGNKLFINEYGFYIYEASGISKVAELLQSLQRRI